MSQKLARDMLKTLPRFAEGGAANSLTPEVARELMQRAMTTGVPTAELNRYGGYNVVHSLYQQGGGRNSLSEISRDDLQRYAAEVANTGTGNLSILPMAGLSLTESGISGMRQSGIDPENISRFISEYGPGATPSTRVQDEEAKEAQRRADQLAQAKAISAGSAKNEISTIAALTKLYDDVLGRAPDADGLLYWTKQFGSDGIIDPREKAIFNASAQIELQKTRETQRLEAERLEAQRLEAQRREMERLAQERMERERVSPSPLPGPGSPSPQIPSPIFSPPNVVSPSPVYPINVTPIPGVAPERPIAALPSTFSGTYNPNLFNEVVARAYNPPAPVGPIYGAFDTNRFIQDPNTFLGTYDFDFFNRLRRPPAPLPAEQPSALLAKGGEVSTNNFLRKRGKMK